MQKITEQPGLYRHLEKQSTLELLTNINREDQKVALAVERCIPELTALIDEIVPRMQRGGRIFYTGAGTSGRLGVLDASECPPTFGVPPEWVVGLIAGGDHALRHPVESAEDAEGQGWEDLQFHNIGPDDVMIGIAASGTTPYVVGGLKACREHGILTACVTCNPGGRRRPRSRYRQYPHEVRYRPKTDPEHDHHHHDDPPRPRQGQPDGRHATLQRETGRPRNEHDRRCAGHSL
jgi:N-acetylmuramic acid 6-phosphate etherase